MHAWQTSNFFQKKKKICLSKSNTDPFLVLLIIWLILCLLAYTLKAIIFAGFDWITHSLPPSLWLCLQWLFSIIQSVNVKSVADRQPHNTTNALKWFPDVSDSWSRRGRVGGKPEEYRKPKQNKWFANVAWGGGDWRTARAGGLVLVRCGAGSGWAAVGDSDGGGERERPVRSVRHLC